MRGKGGGTQGAGLALLLVSVLLAGCADQGSEDDATDTDPPPTLPTGMSLYTPDTVLDGATLETGYPQLADLVALRSDWRSVDGRDAREPTVAVDSTGTIYYAARDYSGGNTPPASATQTPIMRSSDGGLSWTDVSPRLPTGDREPPRSGDPMVVADVFTDRIFQIELYDLVCNWIVFTDDQGESWTSNPKACASVVVDHQTIGAGPSALREGPVSPIYENMVYVCVNQIADSHCARSLDGGLTFEAFTLVYPGVDPECGLAGGIHGHVLVDPSGNVYLPRQYCDRPYVAISRDDGLTWELKDVSTSVGASDQDPNMAWDQAGNLYYLFIGDDERVYLTTSTDQGDSWSDPVRVSPPEVTAANHPSITAGSAGRIGFVFSGTTDVTPLDDDGPEDWDNVTWDAYMALSLNALDDDPVVVAQRTNPDGDPVYRGDCTHQRCGYIREFYDATVAPDGRFYGAFVDACLRPDEPRARNDQDCNTEVDDYGEGNGHLGYLGVTVAGPSLYEAQPSLGGDVNATALAGPGPRLLR